jgi:hypothetical protein
MTKASPGQRVFHVDRDDAAGRWDVCDDEGRHMISCTDKHQAVAYAVRQAMHDHAEGRDVLVCVERPDGTHEIAWSS